MSRINEIKTKIKNIRSTEKITRAMGMISANKMKKAQEVMLSARPFHQAIIELIINISHSCLDQHDFFIKRQENNVGLLIISSDRGLCGGLNINLFKSCCSYIRGWIINNINNTKNIQNSSQIKIVTIGEKAKKFFSQKVFDSDYNGEISVIAHLDQLSKKPKIEDLIGIIQVLLQEYKEKKIDSLYVAYNEFENIMKQNPVVKQLLPISSELNPDRILDHKILKTEYMFEPNADSLLAVLLNRYIESLIYQGVVENIACEQAARMIAMKNATDNATQIIEDLQIYFNKERQAIITKEISEIVGGSVGV